ncbi:MAG: acylphosphatase [Methanothrix sp.]
MPRLTAFISGMVQKTGYRANVVILANAFGLQGYVQNLPSGKVKVVAEGGQTDLERFRSCLTIKDALIDVQSIENEYTAATGDFIGFEKMVSGGETDQRLDKAADLLKDLIVVSKEIVVELKATHEDIRGVRDEVKGSRDDIRGVRDEIKGSRDDIRGVRDEVKGSRDDIRGVHEAVLDVRQEVNNIGEMLAEKIDDAKDEITNEVKELRCDLRDDLKERLIRMEADISQIKAKNGL